MQPVLRRVFWVSVAFGAGGIATSAAACLLFLVLFYRIFPPEYRGYGLAVVAQGMFIIGGIVAGVAAALRRRGASACVIAVPFTALIVAGLCGDSTRVAGIILLPSSIALFAGASVGWLVNRRLLPAAAPPDR